MKAIKINICGSSYLLPESHSDNYEFPSYITEHREQIQQCIDAFKNWSKNPLADMQPTPDMSEFKQRTGIIGAPFDMRDVELYALDKNVDVLLEVNL